MTVAEFDPLFDPEEQLPAHARPCGSAAFSILDTTEVRWFVDGPLPADVEAWFRTASGVAEQRYDTYLLDGRCDIGVKRRFRETLELKVRRSLGERIEFGNGLAGSLETWRKWSPAEDLVDGLVDASTDGRWIDVHKSVVKRRFSIDGTEIAFTSIAEVTGVGCDVEIAEVTVGALRVWTFAFAAFGPPATRRRALLASWHGLVDESPCPEPFGPRTGRAMGYPEWLAITFPPDPEERGGSGHSSRAR